MVLFQSSFDGMIFDVGIIVKTNIVEKTKTHKATENANKRTLFSLLLHLSSGKSTFYPDFSPCNMSSC